jgi:hypothetical protein
VEVQAAGLLMTPITITPQLEPMLGVDGQYYAVEGETQVSPGRPVQPRTSEPLPEFSGMEPHDALFLAGSSTSETGFNPLISRPVTDTTLSEPEYDYDGWYPEKPFTVNRLGDPARLVVVPAQYSGDEESGVEKVFEEMVFGVYYAEAGQEDYAAPAIWEVEKSDLSEGQVTFQVLAQDDSGVKRVVVTYSEDGEQWQSLDLSYGSSGYWKGSLSGLSGEVDYFVQAVDKAGNVSIEANKGLFFGPQENIIYMPLIFRDS